MKNLLLIVIALFPLFVKAQKKESSPKWKKVEELINIKNYEQTLPILADIKAEARSSNNSPEWVRAFLAENRAHTINQTTEASFKVLQNHFKNNIKQANPLEQQVLTNFYAVFLSANIHQLLEKSAIVPVQRATELYKIDSIFRQSLADKERLLEEKTKDWATLLTSSQNIELAPTLYHLLAYNYLSFLDGQRDQTTKVDSLTREISLINKQYQYENANSFVTFRKIFDGHFLNQIRDYPNIKKKLDSIRSDYNANIIALIAPYAPTAKETVSLLNETLNRYPRSPWIANVRKTYNEITKAELRIEHTTFVPVQQYTPIKIYHRNTNQLYIRVYNKNNTPSHFKERKIELDTLSYQVSFDGKLVYEEKVDLRLFDDYENHNSIYKLNPLAAGNYTILISNNPEFKDDDLYKTTNSTEITISDIFVSATGERQNYQSRLATYNVTLINRMTGNPFANKIVRFYENKNKKLIHLITKTTNAKGEITLATKDRLNNYHLYIPDENQLIDLKNLQNADVYTERGKSKERDTEKINGLIMTDRSIYRPGQTVYLKAILYNSALMNGKIIASEKVKLYLKDANNQSVDSLLLNTNTFGSVNGEFRLPVKTLNGNFRIELTHNGKQIQTDYFKVEEYKRPTFKVFFEPNKETYSRIDTVKFEGKTETLSGVSLPQTSIRYSLKVRDHNNWKSILKYDSTTVTDQSGRFYITLPLSLDSLKSSTKFGIEVTAEAVNTAGEMQSASTSYKYADKQKSLSITLPPVLLDKKWKEIKINTTNLNYQPYAFAGEIEIYRIKKSSTILPSGNLSFSFETGYHLLNADQYEKYFPNLFDRVQFENNNKELVSKYRFDTNKSNTVQIDSTLFPYGEYEVKAFTVEDKDTVSASYIVRVLQPETFKISNSDFLITKFDKKTYALDEKVTVLIQTDLKEANTVFISEIIGNTKQETKIIPLYQGKGKYTFQLTNDYIGKSPKINVLLIKDNKIETVQLYIPIHTTDKQLEIKQQTFRDKITPGEKEKWGFTITQKDKQIPTEVLATMYDSALDMFVPHSFTNQFDLTYPYYYGFDLYYLKREFNQTYNVFKPYGYTRKDSSVNDAAPQIRNYGLWNSNLSQLSPTTKRYVSLRSRSESNGVLYDQLNDSELQEVVVAGVASGVQIRGMVSAAPEAQSPLYIVDGEIMDTFNLQSLSADKIDNMAVLKGPEASALYGARGMNGVIIITTKEYKAKEEKINAAQVRTNLQETAFFYPTLYTDKDGLVSFEFDSPEALTKWKLLLFAHGQHLEAGSASFMTQTQKELMVSPNIPRYLRSGDQITIKAQIQNLGKNTLSGDAKIEIINPENNQVISSAFLDDKAYQPFSVSAENNTIVEWKLKVSTEIPVVQIKIVAATAAFSDGEVHELPILSNKILVTDTEKIILKPEQSKTYQIASFGKDNLLTKIQIQSNPIVEIIAALDYLKNYPYECSEQLSSKWFGLKMIQYVQKYYPAISDYFKALDQENSKGKLEENTKLSSLTQEEMPWLRDVKGEQQKLKALAKLFHSDIASELNDLEKKITKNQLPNGAFSWFEGGKENTDISIRILEIFGKVLYLDKTLVSNTIQNSSKKIVSYLDQEKNLISEKSNVEQTLNYLFARHYWNAYTPGNKTELEKLSSTLAKSAEITAKGSAGSAAKAWIVNQLYGTGTQADFIKNRIKQEAITDTDKGMYWESNSRLYNATSQQSYMTEAYKLNDPDKLRQISQWIYYNKQTNHWRTTWMTVDAIYALLLANNPEEFSMVNTTEVIVNDQKTEMGKQVMGQINKEFLKDDLKGNLHITVRNNNTNRTIYGGIYHQYFAPVDEIKASANSLSVYKKYYVERAGKWIESTSFNLGERVKVRLTIINDTPLEYVHIKDSRPSGTEPEYRASGYQWRSGYYFTMKDASTNYFYDMLPKGRHELEYEIKANNTGMFNAGISTAECMYDPSVNARSENLKVEIK
ncbi:MG2 domain-containing protein [Sphingobacterium spiritivorum]|uniref:alpha-2-macroglobulin family protein n=1 Tax=Sphingobacterium spiritivorum TaxID=258 RepID=UPI003DA5BD7B